MTNTAGSLNAKASENDGFEQTGYYTDYDSNGDFTFAGDGLQKHLIFYKQVSSYDNYFPFSQVSAVRGYYVTNYGRRLKYRVIGYNSGVEVFRSGLAEYGTPVNIRGANFSYFDVWLVDEDEDGNLVEVGSLVTSKLEFEYTYYLTVEKPSIGETPTAAITTDDFGLSTPTMPDYNLDLSDALGSDLPMLYGTSLGLIFAKLSPWLIPIIFLVFIRFIIYSKEDD